MRKRKQIGLRAMSTILAAVLLMAGMSTANLPIRDMSVSAKTLAELQDERQANESKIAEKQKKLDSLQSNMNENEQYQKTLKEKIALQQENLDIVSEELKRIGTSISETEDAIAQAEDDITVMETFHALTKDADNLTHLKRGDVITLAGHLTLSVFNAWDESVLSTVGDEKDYQNNASLLFKISGAQNSMLFCSDIKYDMNDYLLGTYRNDISCDYIQAGHHGNWSFSDEFYEAAGASYAFIDAPSSITDNPDFPASTLKSSLQKKGTVFDFSTAPNSVTLK